MDNINLDKVAIHIDKDEDGYPPYETETLWAKKVDNNEYILDNSPFFARGFSLGDRVFGTIEHGQIVIKKVLIRGGNLTYRLLLSGSFNKFKDGLLLLKNIGCDYELMEIGDNLNLYSLDVPKKVDQLEMYKILDKGVIDNIWEFEEADINSLNDDIYEVRKNKL